MHVESGEKSPTIRSQMGGHPPITLTEKRFFQWYEDDKSVSLRAKSGSYGGGSELFVIEEKDDCMGFDVHNLNSTGGINDSAWDSY